MPRGRPKKTATDSKLLQALRFISPIQKAYGPQDRQCCYIIGHQVIAFDGVTMMSMPIDQELNIRVHTLGMIAALESLTGTVSISQQMDHLLVRDASGSKMIYAHTMPMSPIPYRPAMHNECMVGPELIRSLIEVSQVVSNSGVSVRDSSIQLDTGTATATNGEVVLQYWHGQALSEKMYVPKSFADILKKINPSEQMSCYIGNFTLTLGFLDGSFVGTQLYDLGEEIYPDVEPMVASPTYTHQILTPGLLLKDTKLPIKGTKIEFQKLHNSEHAIIANGTSLVAALTCPVLWEGRYNTQSYALVAPYMALVEPHRPINGGAHRITSFMTADYRIRGAILEL